VPCLQPGKWLLLCLWAAPVALQASTIDDLIESNHWKRAYSLTQARISANAADAQAHAWMSKIKETFGDFAASVEEARKAVELDASKAAFHGQLAEACAMTADVSHVLKSLPMVHCMKKEVEQALALDPKNIDTRLVYMMFSWKAPSIAGGDKSKAKQIAEEIRSISPAWGYLALARLLQDFNDDATKEDLLKKAVEADPKFYRARMALATFYAVNANVKHPELAEKLARGMQALEPSNEGAYEILARVFARQGRWQELDEVLAQASKMAPDDATPYYAAAEELKESDKVRAERYVSHYLSQPPEGRQPSHPQARWLLAQLYASEGKKAEAIKELQAALQLDPNFEPAQRDLKRLMRS
jgi:tetratricopeptide (TPR) repeat protein